MNKVLPEIQKFLNEYNELMKTMPKEIPVEDGRWAYEVFAMTHAGVPLKMRRVEDVTAPSSDGTFQIPLRLYYPEVGKPLPCLVYYHGGGWQRGSINSHDSICRNIALKAGCVVVSVEWRLAPEHKFPIGPNDCRDAWLWVREHAKELQIDPERIAMGGDSAGGNMTASTVRRLLDEKGPLPCFQLLFYPALDLTASTKSYRIFETGFFLETQRVIYYVDHYINSAEDLKNPLVNPKVQKDLKGIPPTHIVNAALDPLLYEGVDYAKRLREAGVEATHSTVDGVIHAFLHMTRTVPSINKVFDEIAEVLKTRAFSIDS